MATLGVAGALAAGAVALTGDTRGGTGAPHRLDLPADERFPSPWAAAVAAEAAEPAPLPPTPGFYTPPDWLLPQERECTGQSPDRFYEFYFTRARFGEGGFGGFRGRGMRGGGSWAVDYPKADCQFITVVRRLANLDMYFDSNAISLDDPQLRRFPFLYALEVGRGGGMNLTESEVQGLRDYLKAGGYLVIDDFWGAQEWRNFEREITRVLPEYPIVDIPLDHTLFSVFYTIEEILQVPNVGNAERISLGYSNQTWENGESGRIPAVKGIFDENGRLLVVINFNTDLGDAWEWAEDPYYPLEFSTFAFEMGVNMILYGMTH